MKTDTWKGANSQSGAIVLVIILFCVAFVSGAYSADSDRDGIDDEMEYHLAKSFLPILWYWDHESCPDPGVLLYHVRPFVPGVPDGPLTITSSVQYYEDCGINDHRGDIESFAITVHPYQSSPSGYAAYSMTSVAHFGSECEDWDTEIYIPYKRDLGFTEGPQFFPFWEEGYIADDKHGTFLKDGECDEACWSSDECAPQLVVNVDEPAECRDDHPEDLLVFPEDCGQLFYMYNVGEPNDHLMDTFQELNDLGGFVFGGGPIWSRWNTIEFCTSSPADGIVHDPLINQNPPFPNSVRKGEDISVSFNLGERSLIWVSIYSPQGQRLVKPVLLGEYCPHDSIAIRAWNGRDDYGNTLATGRYLIRLSSEAYSDEGPLRSFDVSGDPMPKPSAPTNLRATELVAGVQLTWRDNSTNEDQFVVERMMETNDGVYTCGYRNIAYVSAHAGTGDITYIDDDVPWGQELRYRVYAGNHGETGGGHSGYSNEVFVETSGVPPLELDVNCWFPDTPDHFHWLDWTFNYHDESMFNSYTAEYRYLFQGDGLEPPNEWSEWRTLMTTDNILLTFYEHDDVSSNGCYQYRVTANVDDGSGWDTYLVSHDFDCEEDPPPGGCPVVFNWDGEQFKDDNNILAMSEIDDGEWTDYYELNMILASSNGGYYLEIREDELEHSYLDNIELLAADHPEGVNVGVTQDGKIFGYSAMHDAQSAVDNEGRDRLEEVSDVGGGMLIGNPQEFLLLSFAAPGGNVLGIREVVPDIPDKAPGPNVWGEEEMQMGGEKGWVEAGTILPRQRGGTRFFDMTSFIKDSESLKVKLEWISRKGIDYVGLAMEETEEPLQVQKLPLLKALHSVDGSVRTALSTNDGVYVELSPGEKILLVFRDIQGEEGFQRNFILVANGYYTSPAE